MLHIWLPVELVDGKWTSGRSCLHADKLLPRTQRWCFYIACAVSMRSCTNCACNCRNSRLRWCSKYVTMVSSRSILPSAFAIDQASRDLRAKGLDFEKNPVCQALGCLLLLWTVSQWKNKRICANKLKRDTRVLLRLSWHVMPCQRIVTLDPIGLFSSMVSWQT